MMGAIPRQIRACEEYDLHPIFACELYCNNLHPPKDVFDSMSSEDKRNLVDDSGFSLRKSYHLLAIAFNNIGYRNLVRLCTWGWMNGFYYRPRVTYEAINQHKEGIIFTSCCYNSEIGQAFDRKGEDAAFDMVEKYMAMFGENFYLELMLLDFSKQKPYDQFIIKAHAKYHIPLILTNDCHYCNEEDSKYQRYMLMIQKETTVQDIEKKLSAEDKADIFELQDTNLWMKSEEEMNRKWTEMYSDVIPDDLFIQAKKNTVEICRKAKGVELDRNVKLPQIPDADLKFKDALFEGFKKRGLSGRQYESRLKEEYELICRKGFASYFLIQKQMTDQARKICPELLGWGNGDEAVGPGRGCLSPDTKIVVGGRLIPIERIRVNDLVTTMDGSQNIVEKVHQYENNDSMVLIKCYGDDHGISLTPEHLVYIKKLGNADYDWMRADQISVGDYGFSPVEDYGCLVMEVKQLPPEPKVYDLTVANNHNYLTSSCLVHNSACGSLACYCLRITDVDPIKHNLLFSRFLSENRGGKSMRLRFGKK